VKFVILLTQPYPQNSLNGLGGLNDQNEFDNQDGSGGPDDPNWLGRLGDPHGSDRPNDLEVSAARRPKHVR